MSTSKPREYWVLAAWDRVPGDQGACFETHQAGLTHVIEHAAYTALMAEAEALRNAMLNELKHGDCSCGADDGSDYPDVTCYLHEALARFDLFKEGLE